MSGDDCKLKGPRFIIAILFILLFLNYTPTGLSYHCVKGSFTAMYFLTVSDHKGGQGTWESDREEI
jgi:hypothetical protein